MRDTIQANTGKTQMEIANAGSIRVNEGAASTILATRHCSHSSIVINTAATTHAAAGTRSG